MNAKCNKETSEIQTAIPFLYQIDTNLLYSYGQVVRVIRFPARCLNMLNIMADKNIKLPQGYVKSEYLKHHNKYNGLSE